MFCPKCGAKNDDDAVFCQRCGTNFKSSNSSNKNILIIFLVIILIIGSLAGLFIVMSNNNSNNQNEKIVTYENTAPEVESSHTPSWHKVGSYNGVSDYSVPVAISGDKIKIEFSAFPIKNYADNDMTVRVYKNGNYLGSANVEWDGNDAVATRSNSLEFSGSGNYQIQVSAYELDYWNMEVYEWY